MVLSKANGIPLYVQIRNALREDIVNKVLLPGQKLPSEDELAARFGVSRMTVRLPPPWCGHLRGPASS